MKAFIFVALVASVAARSFDLDTLRLLREKSLLNRPVVDDVLLKDKLINRLPLEKSYYGDVDRSVLPVDRNLISGVEGYRGFEDVDRVLTFEEIYNTALFRQYLQIPLFRQYIQYPSFQRYVASIYFQRFYQVPTFRQYFLNPVLFYKYIYPIVQVFTTEYNYPINSIYGQRDVLNQDVLGLQSIVDDVVVRNKNVLPYVYNNRIGYSPYTTGNINYKFLLEQLYKNLYVNQQTVGDVTPVTQVQTDVKVLPGDKKVVVEPITGEQRVVVEDPKVIDVQVDQKIVPAQKVQTPVVDSVVPVVDRNVDVLLLKELLRLNVISNTQYEAILYGKIDLVTVLLKERIITPEVYQYIVLGKVDLVTVLRQILGVQFNYDYINRRDVDIDAITRPVNRFAGTDRVNYANNFYNTEIPSIRRDTLFNRLPLQNILGNIVA